MKIIDAHFHYSKISAFYKAAELCGADYSRAGLLKEAGEHQVVGGVCMGLSESTDGGFPRHTGRDSDGFRYRRYARKFLLQRGSES